MRTSNFAATGQFVLSLLVMLVYHPPTARADALTEAANAAMGLGDICFNFQATDGSGDLAGWTRFNVGELDVDWGTNDDGICRGGNPAFPGNFTGGMNGAACVESAFAGPGIIEAYLCSPFVDFSAASDDVVGFRYNFAHLFAPEQELFEVLIGVETPAVDNIESYESIFLQTAPAGGLNGGGVEKQLALHGSVEGGHLCFRFIANDDGYAMVDNLSIGPDACGPSELDEDYDGVANDVDNCVLNANYDQRDSDEDGFGNTCDPDITNDCTVNFADLAALKAAFMPRPYDPNADFNGDGFVSFGDLAILKSRFLQFPAAGPSALSSCPVQ